MKPLLTWAELSPNQKEKAVEHELNDLLRLTCEGSIAWAESQHLFDSAFAKAEAMRTPWFVGEYVMEDCGDLLRQVAGSQAERALYQNPHSDDYLSGCILPNR